MRSQRELSTDEKAVLSRFDDTRWMRRGEIDPVRVMGDTLRRLQSHGYVTARTVHDFDKEYALTEKGLAYVNVTRTTR